MSTAKIVADYLAANNFGIIANKKGWAIAIGHEPDLPNECITIYDTGGATQDTDELDIEYPTIQIRTRAARYADATDMQERIKSLLKNAAIGTQGTKSVIDVMMTTDITGIGRDDAKNFLFTSNYRLMIQSAT